MILSTATTSSYLRDELERQRALFQAQPAIVQRFLEAQAQRLAEALMGNAAQLRFTLPDQVVGIAPKSGEMASMSIPDTLREQTVRGWTGLFQHAGAFPSLGRKCEKLRMPFRPAILKLSTWASFRTGRIPPMWFAALQNPRPS